MIQQLVRQLAAPPITPAQAAVAVLTADPLDLVLRMEQVWNAADLWAPNPGPGGGAGPAGQARRALWGLGQFDAAALPPTGGAPAWDHLGYAFILENTRVVQIMRRVVRAFRSGEGLGVPSVATQRWLDVTEVLLFGAANPLAAWLSTSTVRPDPEAVRRNAYWRLFSQDLAFGTEDNRPFSYDRAQATNSSFLPLFEDLLHELWKAIENIRNVAGANAADDDRIARLAEQIGFMLRTRRQNALLGREELAATTALGWLELTLSSDTPVVADLRAQATTAADRLRLIGERVGLAPHSRATSLFAMASEFSLLLRALEAGFVTSATTAWVLYATQPPPSATPTTPPVAPLGDASRRVITEWSAASGKDLKKQAVPVQVGRAPRPLTPSR